ncbi:unnamed protein product [Prunus armeniaca]
MIVNLGEEYLPKRLKEDWNSISAWIEGSDPGWTGYAWAGLGCQQLQLLNFNCKSIPKFNSGKVLIYFKLCEAFEWAELRLLQSETAEVAILEDSVC